MSQYSLNKKTCAGTGLIALDVVISADKSKAADFLAGGSCGNVLTILSYLGWESYPIARLSNNRAGEILLEDLHKWRVKDDLLTFTSDGSTPVIIHRILKDRTGAPKHRFEFRNPEDGTYLPSYKPCLAKGVPAIVEIFSSPRVFYFDRINRGSIDLAKFYKKQGALIFFEPSSVKDLKGFKECMLLADIVKFSTDRISNYIDFYPTCQVLLEIETLGNDGLQYRVNNTTKWINLNGYKIDNVIDSAGAGDWCTAGIISNIFDKLDKPDFSSKNIVSALQFGQALGALNCTFEGARGLMYNINKTDLMLTIEHILGSQLKKIPQRNRPHLTHISASKSYKISSLFTSV